MAPGSQGTWTIWYPHHMVSLPCGTSTVWCPHHMVLRPYGAASDRWGCPADDAAAGKRATIWSFLDPVSRASSRAFRATPNGWATLRSQTPRRFGASGVAPPETTWRLAVWFSCGVQAAGIDCLCGSRSWNHMVWTPHGAIWYTIWYKRPYFGCFCDKNHMVGGPYGTIWCQNHMVLDRYHLDPIASYGMRTIWYHMMSKPYGPPSGTIWYHMVFLDRKSVV